MKRQHAFTIIELLVSITIILLLIAAASVGVYSARRTSRDTRRIGDIFLYAQAIDSYALATRGTYPTVSGAFGGPTDTICAAEIGGLDSTLFLNNKLAQDPQPVNAPLTGAANHCPDARYGYVYHTEFGHLTALTKNIATAQNMTYALEVGLEGPKIHDEQQLMAPRELLNSAGASLTIQFSDTLNPTGNSRYRYVLNGKYCAGTSSCYN
jgi:prepilin-type N-terminal cleavage/methylation domain-containing protein